MIEQLTTWMVRSGAEWVLWLLFGLGLASLVVTLDRAWVFRRLGGRGAEALVPALRKRLRQGDTDGAYRMLDDSNSVAGRVVSAGLSEADLGAASAEEAMAAAMGLERARLERRLLFLGTVGNNAPFVGLLGTVIGIVGAFDSLGKPQALSGAGTAAAALAPERVMDSIAEALVATAVGLLLAIPAVAVFNHFQRRVTTLLGEAETLGHVLLAHLSGPAAPARELNRELPRSRADRERRDSRIDVLEPAYGEGGE